MKSQTLQKDFLNFCEKNRLEKNSKQLEIINLLNNFIKPKNNFFKFFFNKKDQLGFYLFGDVGVGKTMLFDFFYEFYAMPKQRYHFNEFMIKFHDYKHKDKSNSILSFVQKIKGKCQLIYLDEFQVTNIVDAMILGKLFEKIFEKKIKVIFSSNIEINNLYKDGLQRDQFIPFIKVLENNCHQKKLSIDEDYRTSKNINLERYLTPINKSTKFIFNKFFRKITKNRDKTTKILKVKGRKIEIINFYEKVAKFDFNELCDRNLGSEDYISISSNCDFIFIENLPDFTENNSNQQQRFITLIDIIYEKKNTFNDNIGS